MEYFFLTIVVILFALAITNLMAGVTFNVVNSFNSAMGPNIAPKWIFLLVAGSGILAGSLLSAGIAEIPRTGIFNPGMFVFPDIMVIFLAVMISDVILLDIFNATGIPASSTITILFELAGSATAVSLVKIKILGGSFLDFARYINTGTIAIIVLSVFLSVIVAFFSAAILQYLARLTARICTRSQLRRVVTLAGALFMTTICCFILKMWTHTPGYQKYTGENILSLLVNSGKDYPAVFIPAMFIFWGIFLLFLRKAVPGAIPKFVILAGTFMLAMAFGGNDLAFFTGVPLAGYQSYHAWETSNVISAENLKMDMLTGESKTSALLTVATGCIILLTMIFSRKVKSFYASGVLPGDYIYGVERFGSSTVARMLTKTGSRMKNWFRMKVPDLLPVFNAGIRGQGTLSKTAIRQGSSFDLLRSSVNLFVSFVIISWGIYLKLPLSTIAVTFVAGMGSSLADHFFTRENPVFKISTMISIISGWVISAIAALVVSSFIAWLINAGETPVIAGLLILAAVLVIRTQVLYWRQSRRKFIDDDFISEKDETGKRIEKRSRQVVRTIISANKILSFSLAGFLREDHDLLEEALKLKDELNKKTKKQKNKIIQAISEMKSIDMDSGHFYILVSDYQREVAHSLSCLIDLLNEYLSNQQTLSIDPQTEELRHLVIASDEFFNLALHIVKEDKFEEITELIEKEIIIIDLLHEIETDEINRIKNREVGSVKSMLLFKSLAETKNVFHHSLNLIKSHRDFIIANSKSV